MFSDKSDNLKEKHNQAGHSSLDKYTFFIRTFFTLYNGYRVYITYKYLLEFKKIVKRW